MYGKTKKELAEPFVFWRLEFYQELTWVLFALERDGIVEVGALENFVQALELNTQRMVLVGFVAGELVSLK